MEKILIIYFALVGLCMGSFALAVADRTRSKKNWVSDRSECESCGHKLGARDLVPVASWVATKGHCRHCGVKLSASYPASELLVGFIFLLSYVKFSGSTDTASWLLLALWLVGLVLMQILLIIDLRSFTLPYKFLFPLIAVSALYATVSLLNYPSPDILSLGIAVAAGVGPFLLLYLMSSGKWIGDSDVLFGFVMGFFLMDGLKVWLAVVIASMAGLVYSYLAVVRKTKNYKKIKIPFGPFLILGLVVSYLYGSSMIDWYLTNFLFV
jgi:leader peptidase (prepilin peptidase)/N-methyltransferase